MVLPHESGMLPQAVRPLLQSRARRFAAWLTRDGWLNAASLLLPLGLLVAFLAARDLPVVDLPQHAAQIATWVRWDAHVPEVVGRYELNFRTPYLLAYPLARALSPLVGAVVALKLVVWLAVLGNQLALAGLARRLGHDPWLALFGVVTAMGLCFYFGFISFMLAMPLAVWSLSLALGHARRPSLRSGVLLATSLCLMLTAHGVAFVMGLGSVGILLLRGEGALVKRLAPLTAPILLAVTWFAPGPASQRIGGDAFDLTPRRLLDLPALLVGMGATDHYAFALGLLVLAVTARALRGRLSRSPERVLPLALLLVAYVLFPAMFRGIVLLHTRLPCFLLPLWLLAVEPVAKKPKDTRPRVPVAIAATILVWATVLGVRLVAYNHEAAEFHALEAKLPTGLAIRPLVFDRNTRVFPGVPAYLHYPAYYYVEKGGTQGYSFAMYPLSVVRLRPEVRATMQGGAEWRPELFRREEIAEYDYFLVRSERDRGAELFGSAPVALDVRVGSWWGYKRVSDGPARISASAMPARSEWSGARPSKRRAVGVTSASRCGRSGVAEPRETISVPAAISQISADSGYLAPWSLKLLARPWSAVTNRAVRRPRVASRSSARASAPTQRSASLKAER
jgi:hypothetical protein